MNFWGLLWAAVLFSLACNLDTVLLAIGYATKGVHITTWQCVVVAVITTLVTYLSLTLGATAAPLLLGGGEVLGGLALVGMGLWFLLDWLRGHVEEESATPRRLWGWVSLAAALAVNNGGIGIAAGVTGVDPITAAICNFIITLAALPLGRWLGMGLLGRILGKGALPLSGVLLVVLGVGKVVG